MNKRRLIFFGIFGAYHLLAFIFTLIIQYNSSLLFQLVGYISWFKYGTFLGLLLVVIDFIWWWRESKSFEKNEEAARHENNTLKAKVYDLQETSKMKPVTNPKD
jgi:hypothetical protein